MLRAGDLNHNITFQRPVATTTDGETSVAWQSARTAWAQVTPLRAWQQERSKQVQMNTTHRVRCRYFADLGPDWRIKFTREDGGYSYLNITGMVNVDNRNEEWELTCEQEIVADE